MLLCMFVCFSYTGAMPLEPLIIRDSPHVEQVLQQALHDEQPFLAVGRAARVLAVLLGGTVAPMPSREEKGETEMYRLSAGREDPVFRDLPEVFVAPCFRLDDITVLPLQAVPLANSERTQFQAFKVAGKPIYGVQFEPSTELIERYLILSAN